MANDFVKFCGNLNHYINCELLFIDPQISKHYEKVKNYNAFGSYPIGKLDDIEIMFLHYRTPAEAKEKWERRCKRINWEKLIFKMNDQNGCTKAEAKAFLELPFEHKLFFTIHEEWQLASYDGCYVIKQYSKDRVINASYEPYGHNKYFDLTSLINNL